MTAQTLDRDTCKAPGPDGVSCTLNWLHPTGEHGNDTAGVTWSDNEPEEQPRPPYVGPVYAKDVRNGGFIERPVEEMSLEEWHQSAIGDTRTSHQPVGRMYIVQCSWCPAVFIAHTKTAAMELFRSHEDEMLERKEDERP